MEQRDWEFLEKQVRERRPPRNDGVIVLAVVAVFFAGMILGTKRANENRVERCARCDFTSEWRAADHAHPLSRSRRPRGCSNGRDPVFAWKVIESCPLAITRRVARIQVPDVVPALLAFLRPFVGGGGTFGNSIII